MTKSYMRYWGKAKPADGEATPYHLLAYHSLDVAAVAKTYLHQNKRARGLLSKLTNSVFEEAQLVEVCVFLIALHDLGKFSDAFQGQREDLLKSLLGREYTRPYSVRHDSLGYKCWCKIKEQVLKPDYFDLRDALAPLMKSVCGHHGQPPKSVSGDSLSHFHADDIEAAAEFSLEAAELILSLETLKALASANIDLNQLDILDECVSQLSWWLSGLTVLADWLGSNVDWFKYEVESIPLEDYWARAQGQAATAIKESGLLPVKQAPFSSPKRVFNYLDDLTPLQKHAAETPLANGAQIFILEDVTGSGKTEAALILAHRLMSEKIADGMYFALPTMATANAMYDRVADVYQKLFDNPDDASLVLAHSASNLNSDFKDSILSGTSQEQDPAQSDESASARCAAWLGDNRKKALLAHVGVGTVDQALQSVLPNKHQSLRLFGLLGKVLIVDEVHSADAYMNELLKSVLEFHAAAGGSAILLSATLSQKHRQQLLSAFAKGQGSAAPAIEKSDYPLVTQFPQASGELETKVGTRPSVERSVAVKLEPDLERVYQQISEFTDNGQCVGWVRNTVADAMDAYQRLKPIYGDDCQLFHARYAMGDRLNIENDVKARFGKEGSNDSRRGKVLIGTQVLQESLDLDFDLLITDLAPIDSLVQRAGRLHRHTRINGEAVAHGVDDRQPPQMTLYGPPADSDCNAEWYESYFRKASYVYPDHGQLWLAADVLAKQKAIRTPIDSRLLIESVYAPDAEQNIPSSLHRAHQKAEGDEQGKASSARISKLKLANGYSISGMSDWWSDAKTPTRLGSDTQTITLFKKEQERITPWFSDGKQLAESQIKVYCSKISSVEKPAEVSEQHWQELKQRLPDKAKWSEIAVLVKSSNGQWGFDALNADSQRASYCYDAQLGLQEIVK